MRNNRLLLWVKLQLFQFLVHLVKSVWLLCMCMVEYLPKNQRFAVQRSYSFAIAMDSKRYCSMRLYMGWFDLVAVKQRVIEPYLCMRPLCMGSLCMDLQWRAVGMKSMGWVVLLLQLLDIGLVRSHRQPVQNCKSFEIDCFVGALAVSTTESHRAKEKRIYLWCCRCILYWCLRLCWVRCIR